MKNVGVVVLIAGLFLLVGFSDGFVEAQDFNRDIRPILSDRCFKCHGPDSAANDSGLRLDVAEEAYDSEAFVAGDVDASSAIERMLTDDADLKMPPPDSHLSLSAEEIDLITRWVKSGAKYDQHWAFKPIPEFVVVPHFSMIRDWIKNDIDVFVMRFLETKKLEPSPDAEKWRWLRRVTFDLTGLPPTAEQIAAFETDDDMDAYEKVVDRLLDSEDFGKHLAVSWLDAARYADSYGYQSDQLASNWPYRDWVAHAINENLPYNDFLKWQIAGDMLPEATKDQILATAFNRLHRMTNEGGSVELEWRTEYVADRVNTFGTAMLGLTLECARCHDHKFDPISHKEYFGLSAFFNNIDEWGMYNDGSRVPTPSLLLPSKEQEAKWNKAFKEWFEKALRRQTSRKSMTGKLTEWKKANPEIQVTLEPVAHWSLDELDKDNQFANEIPDGAVGRNSPANVLVEGHKGKALQLTGDDAAEFPVEGNWLEPWQPYSISMWLKIPKGLTDAVILHRQGGTDVGTFGTSLRLVDGRLRFACVRFWPGNADALITSDDVATGKWVHVVVTNSGAGGADMEIYLDGKSVSKPLRRGLIRDPQYRPSEKTGFVVGEQFRRVGFKGGLIDEISVYSIELTPVEVIAIKDGKTKFAAEEFQGQELVLHRLQVEQRTKGDVPNCKEWLQARNGVTEISVMKELPGVSVAHVLHRGEYDAPRTDENVAPRDTPAALPALPSELPQRDRLALAEWLTSSEHPLASRVAVNRIWQGFFGSGLIDTPNDLGYQSQMPVHNGLLDYLARDFMDSGWDVKRLCKMIVLSGTYRQTSRCEENLRRLDPENQWLGRGPANRLTAEMVRDMALFTSGLLNNKTGGPPVSPYQPVNIWRENNTMTPAYNQSVGVDLHRRSLYTVWKRTTPMPNMMTFDATSREVCIVQRSRTNTPQQAMVLLNDVQFVEAARVMAEKALAENGDGTDAKIVQWLFVRLAGRNADDKELPLLVELLTDQRKRYSEDTENANLLAKTGETPAAENADVIEVAAVTVLTQAIMSSDATIWKR